MLEVAAEELEVDADDLETDGKGNIHVKGAPHEVDLGVRDGARRPFQARPTDLGPRHVHDAALLSGARDRRRWPSTCYAHACTVAEVEVDDETGEVTVLSAQERLRGRPRAQPEDGRAADHRRRLDGHEPRALRDDRALLSRPRPWPDRLQRISDAGPGDLAETEISSSSARRRRPVRREGVGEMTANPPIPAIANAIFDAVGVRVDSLPITPERILRALKAQRAAG